MNHVVIVAGGRGTRMGGSVPKQFMLLGGRPVLMWTIERFVRALESVHIILVLPPEEHEHWRSLCRDHAFDIVHDIVSGGATRYLSSRNGIAAVDDSDDAVVAIHDGVRPLVSISTIERCFDAARKHGAAIPVVPVTDTLRLVTVDGRSHNVLRSDYRAVQTPQAFRLDVARKAFAQEPNDAFTDDASVAEAAGFAVTMVDGNDENIKLTTPKDILIAETLMHRDR